MGENKNHLAELFKEEWLKTHSQLYRAKDEAFIAACKMRDQEWRIEWLTSELATMRKLYQEEVKRRMKAEARRALEGDE